MYSFKNSVLKLLPIVDVSYLSFLVQFWYCSNYHWFLKQELKFTENCLNDLCWDGENPLKFHILTKDGIYTSYRFCWEIFQSRGHHVNNDATVVMVDGGIL